MRRRLVSVIASCACSVISYSAAADPVDIPNVFTAGATARASDVNENFAVVEAAINAHDVSIKDNGSEINALKDEVHQLRQPVAVFSGGSEIGLLIGDSTFNGQFVVLTTQGYDFILSRKTGEVHGSVYPTYYATPNCSGQTFAIEPPGSVFRSMGDDVLRYVDRDSPPVSITNGSYSPSPGDCSVIAVDTAWPSQPNDPAITGVSNQSYPLPIKSVRP